MYVREEAGSARKTQYTVVGGEASDGGIVGLEPMIANTLAYRLTCEELGINLRALDAEVTMKASRSRKHRGKGSGTEMKHEETRFDFADETSDPPVYVEVKSVPLAQDGCAYFPHGTPRKKGEPVSERANKHLKELAELVREHNAKSVVLFISQRCDIHKVVPSYEDPTFREALQEALDAGVIAKAFSVRWHISGECTFEGELPIDMQCEPPRPPTPPKKQQQQQQKKQKSTNSKR